MKGFIRNMSAEAEAGVQRLLNQSEDNLCALEKVSRYLNLCPRYIQPDDLKLLTKECGVPEEEAYALLMAAACGIHPDESSQDLYLTQHYLIPGIHCLKPEEWRNDPYLQCVRMPEANLGNWRLGYKRFEPYEAFPLDDPHAVRGMEILQIGYFREAFETPVAEENGREWMTVTPCEQNTMTAHIEAAFGKTAVFGLGLGYYAMRASQKPEVTEVVVIEREEAVLSLVKEYLLPQFPNRDKIRFVQADAFEYAEHMESEAFDCAYVDLWHDVLDGVEMYLRFRRLEKYSPRTQFMYWIEPSILMWLRGMALEELREGKPGLMFDVLGESEDLEELAQKLSYAQLRNFAPRIPLEVARP